MKARPDTNEREMQLRLFRNRLYCAFLRWAPQAPKPVIENMVELQLSRITPEEIIMHPVSQMLIQQAEAIDGYSVDTLIKDLLGNRVKLVNYAKAAEEVGVRHNTIAIWVSRGVLKRYGTGGAGARVNLYEVMQMFLNPPKEGKPPRKQRTVTQTEARA